MTLTVKINDLVAAQLNSKAAAYHLSVEEFAAQLLDQAVQHLETVENQRSRNERRLALIRKSTSQALTADELAELQTLQDTVDRELEPVDDQLLAQLAKMRSEINELVP